MYFLCGCSLPGQEDVSPVRHRVMDGCVSKFVSGHWLVIGFLHISVNNQNSV